MAKTITRYTAALQNKQVDNAPSDNLLKQLQRDGRLPPVKLSVKPLDGKPVISLNRFLSYKFSSSILIPVDSFSFSFVNPDSEKPLNRYIKDGDIVSLSANGTQLSVGIIDQTEVEIDREFGEKNTINGRDLLLQLEDQDSISFDDRPILGALTVKQAVSTLLKNTRVSDSKIVLQDLLNTTNLFMTQPGESKMAALLRYLDPLNALVWLRGDGSIVIGKPNMRQSVQGKLILSKDKRQSNVLSMVVTRSSTKIPNLVVGIWQGQETTQDRVTENQKLYNKAEGPSRLRKANHRLSRSVVVSNPDGNGAQGQTDANRFRAGTSNVIQAYMKREIARANMEEMIVQARVPGHYNENGIPFQVDQTYTIEFDRGDIPGDKMYLYQVEYEGSNEGQYTNLWFCKLQTIVADTKVK